LSIKRLIQLGLLGAAVVVVLSLVPGILKTYFPNSSVRSVLMDKPLAAVNFSGNWSTILNGSDGNMYPGWEERFLIPEATVQAQDVFDHAAVIVVVVENRSDAVIEDPLSRALGLQQRFDKMRSQDQDITILETSNFSVNLGWPLVNFTRRRFVLIHAQEGMVQKYKGSCHAELITAWAASNRGLPALTRRCKL